jgi:hypothetical protein
MVEEGQHQTSEGRVEHERSGVTANLGGLVREL